MMRTRHGALQNLVLFLLDSACMKMKILMKQPVTHFLKLASDWSWLKALGCPHTSHTHTYMLFLASITRQISTRTFVYIFCSHLILISSFLITKLFVLHFTQTMTVTNKIFEDKYKASHAWLCTGLSSPPCPPPYTEPSCVLPSPMYWTLLSSSTCSPLLSSLMYSLFSYSSSSSL